MEWTRELMVKHLIGLPWSVSVSQDEDGDWVARVAELPSVLATGSKQKEVAKDLYDALWTLFDAMLEYQDPIPLPEGASLPWERGEAPRVKSQVVIRPWSFNGAAWDVTASSIGETRTVARAG